MTALLFGLGIIKVDGPSFDDLYANDGGIHAMWNLRPYVQGGIPLYEGIDFAWNAEDGA